jgi:high-affinity nickel-transport protein
VGLFVIGKGLGTPEGRTVGALLAVLLAANLGAWGWALSAFASRPTLLGTALLAWVLGLRHAVDADHIAAIDNVVRKLMQRGRRPLAVGFYFSLGHSTVVVLASAVLAFATVALKAHMASFKIVGGVVGAAVSAGFLLLIAVVNIVILVGAWRQFRQVSSSGVADTESLEALFAGQGVLARMIKPLFRLVTRSWHMYLLGFLFGLGFDTATEVGLLGLSASQATLGVSPGTVLVFPALFTAGMALVDTLDSVMMVGAYGWAFVNPIRKLWYNLTMTAASVAVAVLIGGVEALGLFADRFELAGGFWSIITALNHDLADFGFLVIGAFAAVWGVSSVVFRLKGYGREAVS